MTEKMTLRDFAKENGQQKTAEQLGISQFAVSKAVNSDRQIFVFKENGRIFATETRPFPAKSKKETS